MIRAEDIWAATIVVVGILLWLWSKRKSGFLSWREQDAAHMPRRAEGVDLLEEAGYRVVSVKEQVQVDMNFVEKWSSSRILIDFVVEKNGRTYLAKVRPSRQEGRVSNSFLRKEFLPWYLIYQPAGILYIDLDKNIIKKVIFRFRRPRTVLMREWRGRLLWLVVGMVVMALIVL